MNLFIGASLISSFIAGMIALFAPCCVSYLLPAYLGSIFKERRQVFLMTIVFSLGIFTIMFPIVLGFRFLSDIFLEFHNQTFLLGGVIMIAIGIIAFLGLKLPMVNVSSRQTGKQGSDILSVYTLGIFSGITSSCCAPVLFGVLALSVLSPSFWQAGLIAFFYVLGIVAPLYIGAYFVDTRKLLNAQFFKKHLFDVELAGKKFPIIMSSLLAALIFIPMGILTIYLTLTNRLEMQGQAQRFGNFVGQLTIWINNSIGNSPITQTLFLLIVLALIAWLFLKWKRSSSM